MTNNYIPHEDTKTKHYINQNVYTAAKQRIHDAINQSDNQAVLCSGGKDSVALAYLLSECYKEKGINKPVNLIFMDEELINEDVIRGVKELGKQPEFNLYWISIPMTCDMYNTGKTREYIQNDPKRRHVREPPEEAITPSTLGLPDDTIVTRYQLKNIQAKLFPGRVCLFKGIRTEESLFRLTQVIRRKHSPHIGAQTPKHFECVPIYDWTEHDVFLYYYKNDIKYNHIYDKQMWAGAPLRVSTPTHTYNTDTYNKLRSIDPKLYQNIIEVFPDMAHADRYNNEIKGKKEDFTDKYPHTIQGLMQYIDDTYTDNPEHTLQAKRKILWAYKRREQNKQRKGSDKFGGYPLYYLFGIIQRGATLRHIIPREKPSLNCYLFEGMTIEDMIEDKNKRGTYT